MIDFGLYLNVMSVAAQLNILDYLRKSLIWSQMMMDQLEGLTVQEEVQEADSQIEARVLLEEDVADQEAHHHLAEAAVEETYVAEEGRMCGAEARILGVEVTHLEEMALEVGPAAEEVLHEASLLVVIINSYVVARRAFH